VVRTVSTGNREHKGYLYLPIETKVRELDAKILLACVAAERGFSPVIGELKELRGNLLAWPEGHVLFKAALKTSRDRFRSYREYGHSISMMCEEGLVYLDKETYQRTKVHPEALQYVDLFLAWGAEQKEAVVEKYGEISGRIAAVGNPRMDLLRREFRDLWRSEVDQLRRRFGPFIMVNTNFGVANFYQGTQAMESKYENVGMIRNESDRAVFRERVEFQRSLIRHLKDLVIAMSRRFPGHRVVVRPHPSEKHEFWRESFDACENVDVVFEGGIVPWLAACDLLVENGCTTAIEAWMLDRPVVEYRPCRDDRFEPEVTRLVSYEADDDADALSLVERLLESGGAPAPKSARLERYLSRTDGCLSSEAIIEHVSQLQETRGGRPGEAALTGHRHRGGVGRLLRRLKDNRSRRTQYEKQKFPGLEKEEIEGFLCSLRQVSGRFGSVRVEQVPQTSTCYRLISG